MKAKNMRDCSGEELAVFVYVESQRVRDAEALLWEMGWRIDQDGIWVAATSKAQKEATEQARHVRARMKRGSKE